MKTKDGRDQIVPERRDSTFPMKEVHAETFRFNNLYPGEIELKIEEIKEKIGFLNEKMEAVEMIKYTDPDREKLYIETQDQIRVEKIRLRNAEEALRESYLT